MTGADTKAAAAARQRLAALSADRKAALLDPAEAEFAECGLAGASFNRILANAGISKGQAYYYVTGKADLYEAVIERALSRLMSRLDVSLDPPETAEVFWARIRDGLDGLNDIMSSDPRLAALIRGIDATPEVEAALARPLAALRSLVGSTVATGQSLGAIRGDLPQSFVASLVIAVTRETDRWFKQHDKDLTPLESLTIGTQTLSLIRAMLAPPTAIRSE